MNEITQLKFALAYYDVTVQQVSHFVTGRRRKRRRSRRRKKERKKERKNQINRWTFFNIRTIWLFPVVFEVSTFSEWMFSECPTNHHFRQEGKDAVITECKGISSRACVCVCISEGERMLETEVGWRKLDDSGVSQKKKSRKKGEKKSRYKKVEQKSRIKTKSWNEMIYVQVTLPYWFPPEHWS